LFLDALYLNGFNMKKFFERIRITKEHVSNFKKITKDNNSIHFKSNVAKKMGFKDKVIQGMLTSSFISKIIGNKIPGDGALWTGCNLSFYKPVYLNDIINFETEIENISTATKTLFLAIIAKNQNNEIVLEADAQVKYPKKFEKKFTFKKREIDEKKIIEKRKTVSLIIGGSSEIGKKIVEKLSLNNLTISTYNSKNQKFFKKSKNLIYKKLNLLNKKNLESFIKNIKKEFIINKFVFLPAGKILFKDLKKIKVQDLNKEFNLQLISLFRLVQGLEENFKKDSSIVVMGSDAALGKPPQKMMIYSLIKSSLVSFAKNLSVEFSQRSIRVNCISPGIIDTKLTKDIPEIVKEFYKVNSLTGNLTTIQDVVNLTLYLLSNKSKNISGANLGLNGGYSID